jgi:hypothetical protein
VRGARRKRRGSAGVTLEPRPPMDGSDDLARRFSGDSHMKWAPVVDGTVLPESPLSAVGAGRARGTPILAGATAHEVVADGYEFAKHLLADQRRFADEVIKATSPLRPGRGRGP